MPEPTPESTVTYHRDEFYQKLSEVQGRLAELRYIDRATEYLESEQAGWWENQPIGSQTSMEVQFGATVPFVRTYDIGTTTLIGLPWQETKEDEVTSRLREIADEASTWAADSIAALTASVEPLTYPSPSTYQHSTIAPLDETRQVLQDEVSTDFGLLMANIGHWEGDAADNFMSHFYYPFEDMLASHEHLIEVLAGGLVTAKAIVESTQHSLMNAVHYTWQRLYRQLELRSLNTVEDNTTTILVIGVAVTSLMAAVFSGGLWAVGMAAVASGLSVAATEIPEDGAATIDLFGSSAEQIVEALDSAIGTIETNMVDHYRALEREVGDVLTRVGNLRERGDEDYGRLVPAQPDLVDGVDADTFRLPDVG